MHSNHTENSPQLFLKRAAYVAAHREYIAYLYNLLDTAVLPANTAILPNVTNMAAMVAEMRAMHPTAPWLNGVVLGRVLHRVLPWPLLTWHGGKHVAYRPPYGSPAYVATTVYRFPEVVKSRAAVEFHTGQGVDWSNDFDQWQIMLDTGRRSGPEVKTFLNPSSLSSSRTKNFNSAQRR